MRILSLFKFLLIIIILAGCGVLGYFGYNYLTSSQNNNQSWENKPPVTLSRVSLSLDLNSPDDQTVLFDKSLLVSGRTSPKATIIISDDGGYSALTADQNGNFSRSVTLDEGLNHITVTAFDDQGNSKALNRTIYYTPNQL